MKKGRVNEAIKAYEEAIQASPNIIQIPFNLADSYFQVGRYDDSLNIYEQMLQARPDDPVLLFRHARVLFKKGENQRAIAGFRRALEIDPSFKEAAEGLKAALGSAETPEAPAERTGTGNGPGQKPDQRPSQQ